LNSASFKKPDGTASCHPPNVNSDILSSCPDEQMAALHDWVRNNGEVLSLIFTHIPDLRDPKEVDDAKGNWKDVPSAWKIDPNARVHWSKTINSPSVIGLFAGHFHANNKLIYHPANGEDLNLWQELSDDSPLREKTWLAPPLGEKFQRDSKILGSDPPTQARGFVVYRVQDRLVTAEKFWYR
jgi:hypothetical protein